MFQSEARSVTSTPDKRKRGDPLSPSSHQIVASLLLIVQFYRVARVDIFQREDDHGRR